jgi:hypothetical protein
MPAEGISIRPLGIELFAAPVVLSSSSLESLHLLLVLLSRFHCLLLVFIKVELPSSQLRAFLVGISSSGHCVCTPYCGSRGIGTCNGGGNLDSCFKLYRRRSSLPNELVP